MSKDVREVMVMLAGAMFGGLLGLLLFSHWAWIFGCVVIAMGTARLLLRVVGTAQAVERDD